MSASDQPGGPGPPLVPGPRRRSPGGGIFQLVAMLFSLTIFAVGAFMAIRGAAKEASEQSVGKGLVSIVVGSVVMTMAGIAVSVAGKLLRD